MRKVSQILIAFIAGVLIPSASWGSFAVLCNEIMAQLSDNGDPKIKASFAEFDKLRSSGDFSALLKFSNEAHVPVLVEQLRSAGVTVEVNDDQLYGKQILFSDQGAHPVNVAVRQLKKKDPNIKVAFSPMSNGTRSAAGSFSKPLDKIFVDREIFLQLKMRTSTNIHEIGHWRKFQKLIKGENDPLFGEIRLKGSSQFADLLHYRGGFSVDELEMHDISIKQTTRELRMDKGQSEKDKRDKIDELRERTGTIYSMAEKVNTFSYVILAQIEAGKTQTSFGTPMVNYLIDDGILTAHILLEHNGFMAQIEVPLVKGSKQDSPENAYFLKEQLTWMFEASEAYADRFSQLSGFYILLDFAIKSHPDKYDQIEAEAYKIARVQVVIPEQGTNHYRFSKQLYLGSKIKRRSYPFSELSRDSEGEHH